MNRFIWFVFPFLVVGFMGCRSFHHGGVIELSEHDLSTPEGTYRLFRAACEADDPDAAWACLTRETRERIGYGSFLDGWTVLGRLIPYFSKTRIEAVHPTHSPDALRAEVGYRGRVFGFLLLREEGEWRIRYPSPYHEPERLVEFLREIAGRRPLPPRRGEWPRSEEEGRGTSYGAREAGLGFVVPLGAER